MQYKSLFLMFSMVFLGSSQSIECSSSLPAVTNPHVSDGFGAQFLHIIATAIYAEQNGMRFIYSPFKTMEHNYQNDPDFLRKKEWLINFVDNFEVNKKSNVFTPPHVIIFFYSETNMAYLVNSPALKNIKKIFRANKNVHDYFNPDYLNIVVHVRRHNQHDSRIEGTDTPDDLFLNIINKLRIVYAGQNPLFHLHSQGSSESFKQYAASDVVLHLNESTEDAFTAMVLADVLVTSKSDFSYTAALLSDGIVYYLPFYHPRLPQWISVDTLLGS